MAKLAKKAEPEEPKKQARPPIALKRKAGLISAQSPKHVSNENKMPHSPKIIEQSLAGVAATMRGPGPLHRRSYLRMVVGKSTGNLSHYDRPHALRTRAPYPSSLSRRIYGSSPKCDLRNFLSVSIKVSTPSGS